MPPRGVWVYHPGMDSHRILALEPWYAGSHRAVADSITRHSRHGWRWLTRTGGGVRWCLRHAGVVFAEELRAQHVADVEADLVFVSSLCSLSDFRAAAPEHVRRLPHVLYMHENQAAYPASDSVDLATKDRDVHLAFTNLASMVAADRVLFNSEYNLQSFIAGMDSILRHAPYKVDPQWSERLVDKSLIAWPPVEDVDAAGTALHNPGAGAYPDGAGGRGVVRVAWPHRWEHDKGCGELLDLVERCRDDPRYEFRWSILGHRFKSVPAEMDRLKDRHSDIIDHWGGLESRKDYMAALAACDWVTSTARHEFFGIAVVEAMLAGCLPWLPDRLSYPELVPESIRGVSPWNPPADPRDARARIIEHLGPATAVRAVTRIDQALAELIDPP